MRTAFFHAVVALVFLSIHAAGAFNADVPMAVLATQVDGGGEPVTASNDDATVKSGGTNSTQFVWPGQVFNPNEAKAYVAAQGCANGAAPVGCGCGNGDYNLPVLAQALVTARVVASGSCMCTYYMPAGFMMPGPAFAIRVQNLCA